MDTTYDRLQLCVQQGIIDEVQAARLADALPHEVSLTARQQDTSMLVKTLYYLGGFLIVFAVTYFLSHRWEDYSDKERILISFGLVLGFGVWGAWVQRSPYRVGAGLLLLASTASMPLLIYSIERATGIWPADVSPTYQGFLGTINSAWVILDTLSLLASSLMFWKFREPILTLPIAHFVWFLALDAGDLYHPDESSGFLTSLSYRTQLTILAGGLLVAWGIWYSVKKDARVGVWPWVYGLSMVLGGLTVMRWENSAEAYTWLTYLLLFSLACLFIAPALRSRTFTTFGAIGLVIYLNDLYYDYYRGSMEFSVSLAAVGIAVILIGMAFQRVARNKPTAAV